MLEDKEFLSRNKTIEDVTEEYRKTDSKLKENSPDVYFADWVRILTVKYAYE